MISNNIGLDLGTSNVLVSIPGKGIVLSEPSVAAIEKNTGTILAVGEEAYEMIGKAPSNIIPIRPLENGTISNFHITEKMLNHFMHKALKKKSSKNSFISNIVVCIPSEITNVEKIAVEDTLKNIGAKRIHLIEGPIAAAIGAGLDITTSTGHMVVDIGGGTTDIAIISLGEIVISKSINVGGNQLNNDIISAIKTKHNFIIGEKTAEKIKNEIGTVFNEEEKFLTVSGINLLTGLPNKIQISSLEIKDILEKCTKQILSAICSILEQTPPELVADIYDSGILMTGGGALLNGLDKRIQEKTNLNVTIAEDSLTCAVKGTECILKSPSLIKNRDDFK